MKRKFETVLDTCNHRCPHFGCPNEVGAGFDGFQCLLSRDTIEYGKKDTYFKEKCQLKKVEETTDLPLYSGC